MKRKTATAAELEACKRDFHENSAAFALQRAKRSVRAGEPIERRDREFIAWRLDVLFRQELDRMHEMRDKQPVRFRAYMADYVQEKLRITLEQAAAAVAGDHNPDSIRKAVDRIRAGRRARNEKGRARR